MDIMIIDTFPNLYALDKSGRIKKYSIRIDPIKENEFNIKSITGLLRGKQTYRQVKVTKGKHIGKSNETTAYEQTLIKARSDHNSKLNEGYKSINDLSLKAESMDVMLPEFPELIGNLIEKEYKTVEYLFRELKIKYNTDTRWYPLPMLAEKYKDKKKSITYPVFIQPKLNGVRCQIMYDKNSDKIAMNSRGGGSYYIPHISDKVFPYLSINQNLVLDGELYADGKSLQQISGAARKAEDAPTWLEFRSYDCFYLDGKPKAQSIRLQELASHILILRQQFDADAIHFVDTSTANNEEEVQNFHDSAVHDGYEGAIVRDQNEDYQISFRTSALLKVKQFEDEEFELVDCEVDPNKGIAESFVFILQNNKNDKTFKAKPSGSIAERLQWYSDRSWVGKMATVRYPERSDDGTPIQGHVRADKTPSLIVTVIDDPK